MENESHQAVAYELTGHKGCWKPEKVHVFMLGDLGYRLLCGVANVRYSVDLDVLWNEPQRVQRCARCRALAVRADGPGTC